MIDPQEPREPEAERGENARQLSRSITGVEPGIDDWTHVPIEWLTAYIEASIQVGIQWAVFEPNDEPLWAELTLHIADFMQRLFTQGAFRGAEPAEAYYVKCDAEINLASNIEAGVVNINVGFAPVKPAEFVVIEIQQWLAPCASGDC